MGLNIKKGTDFGVDVEYWNIANIAYSKRTTKMCISLNGYLTEADYRDGKEPLVSGEVIRMDSNSLVSAMYNELKEVADWNGATDIIETEEGIN